MRSPWENPTIAWPDDRQQSKFGTLTLSSAFDQKGTECEAINFDPLILSDGVEASNDPVLLFRSGTYGISHSKRVSES